jgi:hypothetical protein
MNRPLGVDVFAWMAFCGGAFAMASAALGFVALARSAGEASASDVFDSAFAGVLPLLVGVALFALGILALAVGFGALRLYPVAWTAGVAWCYASGVANAFSVFVLPGASFLGALVGMAIAGVMLYCLYADEVKSAFGKQTSATPMFLTAIRGSFGQSAETPGG